MDDMTNPPVQPTGDGSTPPPPPTGDGSTPPPPDLTNTDPSIMTMTGMPPIGMPPGFGDMGSRPASPRPPIVFNTGRPGVVRRMKGTEEKLVGTRHNDKLMGDRRNNRLMGGSGNDELEGGVGNDHLFGDAGNDKLRGGIGNDKLNGGDGDDLLEGGAGNDQLLDGKGDDILCGGQGRDLMFVSAGKDTLRYDSLKDGGDLVRGFSGQNDLIDLRPIFSKSDFSSVTDPQQLMGFVKMERMGNSTRVMIDADGAGQGRTFVTLVTLQGVAPSTLSAANFVVS